MEEIWKMIDDYGCFYEVSSFGNIRSTDRIVKGRWGKLSKAGKIMKPGIDTCGYRFAHFRHEGKSITIGIHRLVAKYFLGKKPENSVIDHIDGNKENNSSENLQYISQRDNCIKGRMSKLKDNKISQFTGVTYDRSRNKWKAQIRSGSKNICLGRFQLENDARDAYLKYVNS